MATLVESVDSSGGRETALTLSPDGTNAREVIRTRLEKLNSIPTVPAIVRPLLHYMEKPIDQMEVKRVVDMISCDESVAAQCLRMANSALYFLPQIVKTIHGAVIVLGVRQVREILLACSLLNLVPKDQNLALAMSLWEHSLGAPCWAGNWLDVSIFLTPNGRTWEDSYMTWAKSSTWWLFPRSPRRAWRAPPPSKNLFMTWRLIQWVLRTATAAA